MEGKRIRDAGVPDEAPLLGQSTLTLPTFVRARNNRGAMHEVLRVCRTAHSPSRTGDNHSLTVFGSLDFQTCYIADSLNRPGVKRRSRWVWKPVLRRSGGTILLIT
jgi:hypothetical protein